MILCTSSNAPTSSFAGKLLFIAYQIFDFMILRTYVWNLPSLVKHQTHLCKDFTVFRYYALVSSTLRLSVVHCAEGLRSFRITNDEAIEAKRNDLPGSIQLSSDSNEYDPLPYSQIMVLFVKIFHLNFFYVKRNAPLFLLFIKHLTLSKLIYLRMPCFPHF